MYASSPDPYCAFSPLPINRALVLGCHPALTVNPPSWSHYLMMPGLAPFLQGYASMTKRLTAYAGGKVVLALEGGYNTRWVQPDLAMLLLEKRS